MTRKVRSMAVLGKPTGLKMRGFIDDVLSPMIGKRLFTSIITDSALERAVTRDARRRAKLAKVKGAAGKSNRSLTNAASVYKALHTKTT